MKHLCSAVLPVFLLTLFANAQEAPLPPPPPLPPSDSSQVTTIPPVAPPPPANIYYPAVQNPPPPQEMFFPIAPPQRETKIEDYSKNLRMVAYLHPIPLFFGAANDLFMFNATVEIPLSLNNSAVIQPAIWLGSSDGFFDNINLINFLKSRYDQVEYKKLKRFGTGLGLRHYLLSERGSGIYLQAIAGAYFISAESISLKEDDDDYYYYYPDEITTWTKVKGAVGELLFYVGLAHKWQNISLSYEVGLGFGYDGTNTHQLGYINSLATNFNFCLGIPF